MKDLLDEVSEAEDRIVRTKALEHGDRLMARFRQKVGELPITDAAQGNKGNPGWYVLTSLATESRRHANMCRAFK